jgi:hypothetical protein
MLSRLNPCRGVCKIELFSRPRHQVLSADSLPWRERITISRFKLKMLYRCVRPYHDGRAGNHEVQGGSWQIDLSPKSLGSADKRDLEFSIWSTLIAN